MAVSNSYSRTEKNAIVGNEFWLDESNNNLVLFENVICSDDSG